MAVILHSGLGDQLIDVERPHYQCSELAIQFSEIEWKKSDVPNNLHSIPKIMQTLLQNVYTL